VSRVKIAVAVLFVVVVAVWGAQQPRHAPETAARSGESATPPAASAPTDRGGESELADKEVFPVARVHRVVAGFTDGWLLRDAAKVRERVLSRYATADLVAGLVLTDVRLLPRAGTHRAGDPMVVEESGAYAVFEQHLSDGSGLLVRVAHVGDGRWRVVSVLPADSNDRVGT
jgi:hypothetical protein